MSLQTVKRAFRGELLPSMLLWTEIKDDGTVFSLRLGFSRHAYEALAVLTSSELCSYRLDSILQPLYSFVKLCFTH